jgi:hypothetical protein
MAPTKKIMVCVLNEGEMRVELSALINDLTQQGKYDLDVRYPHNKPITFNRNEIVKSFLATNADYLLMIDDDIVPPSTILNLADFQEDIVAATCFAFTKDQIMPVAWNRRADGMYYVPTLTSSDGLTKVDTVGTGCIMIKRSVLENPWWKEHGGWFKNEYDKTGYKEEGNDLAFCRKATDLGYNVFVHTDYQCSHIVPMDLKFIYNSLTAAKADGENKKQ